MHNGWTNDDISNKYMNEWVKEGWNNEYNQWTNDNWIINDGIK